MNTINTVRVLSISMIMALCIGQTDSFCMRRSPKMLKQDSSDSSELKVLKVDVQRFADLCEKTFCAEKFEKKFDKKGRTDAFETFCLAYFSLVDKIGAQKGTSQDDQFVLLTEVCKQFEKSFKGTVNRYIDALASLEYDVEENGFQRFYSLKCCASDLTAVFMCFLGLQERILKDKSISHKEMVVRLQYIIGEIRGLFGAYTAMKSQKDLGPKGLSKFSDACQILFWKYLEIGVMMSLFVKDFAFVKAVFQGKVNELISFDTFSQEKLDFNKIEYVGHFPGFHDFGTYKDLSKIDYYEEYEKKSKSLCIDLASDFETKSCLVAAFFSDKQEVAKIKKDALCVIKKLKKLRIQDLTIEEDMVDVDSSQLTMLEYLISRITFSQAIEREVMQENGVRTKVFITIVHLPCLQQVGGTCQFHALANNFIFAKNSKLSEIIKQLNNSNDLVNKAKKVHERDDLEAFLLKKSIQRYNCMYPQVKSKTIKVFNIGQCERARGMHCFAAKVCESENKNKVIFYADSEHLALPFRTDDDYKCKLSYIVDLMYGLDRVYPK